MKSIKFIILGFILISLASCRNEFFLGCIDSEGDVETREFDYGTFDQLSIGVSSTVELIQSENNSVTITAATNILDRIDLDSEKSGNSLSLEINGCTRINNDEVTIVVEMKDIQSLGISGDAILENEGILTNMENLDLRISGDGEMTIAFDELDKIKTSISGDGELEISGIAQEYIINVSGDGLVEAEDLITTELEIKTSGSSTVYAHVLELIDIQTSGSPFIEVSGTAVEQNINMSGGGDIKNTDLITDITNIDISGDTKCEVFVNTALDVKISGEGEVCYKGEPTVTSDISGNGEIKECN